MLNEHTLDQLRSLRLDGMLRAIEEQASSASADELGFDDRLTLLVQREVAWRDDRRVARLLKTAKLKVAGACIEDINWRVSRGLDRGVITALAGGDWLRHAGARGLRAAQGIDSHRPPRMRSGRNWDLPNRRSWVGQPFGHLRTPGTAALRQLARPPAIGGWRCRPSVVPIRSAALVNAKNFDHGPKHPINQGQPGIQ